MAKYEIETITGATQTNDTREQNEVKYSPTTRLVKGPEVGLQLRQTVRILCKQKRMKRARF